MSEKGKSIDGLMRHIRQSHKIKIEGSSQKRTLRNIGYYHGYKAYRFVRKKNNLLSFTTFDEIKKTYNFDNTLKALLYPEVMKVETAINNYTLEVLVTDSDIYMDSIFKQKLNHFDDFPKNSKEYKKEMGKFLNLRRNMEGTIANNYTKSSIIQHYVHQNKSIPFWAIFEHTTMGDLGSIIERLNNHTRRKIQEDLGCLDTSLDTNLELLSKHIFIIKDLRNAIAHNNVVFDCRFNTFKIKGMIIKHLEKHTKVKNINFKTITDYVILIAYYLKLLRFSKVEIRSFITRYEKIIKEYSQTIKNPHDVHLILGVDSFAKIKLFLKNL